MNIAYLNGSFVPLDQARISPLDRGFLFADAVYEVMPVYNHQLFRLEQHLQRLANSLTAIRLSPPMTASEWQNVLTELVQHNKQPYQNIYLQISRGVEAERCARIPNHLTPTVFAYSMPGKRVNIDELACGISVITTSDQRWQNCHIKTTNLLANCMARTAGVAQGAHETILVQDNKIHEGSSSNLFIIQEQVIKTPPTTENILPGITREYVIELARELGYTVLEITLTLDELINADEAWITSSTRSILPIIKVNSTMLGSGDAGPVWHKLIRRYYSRAYQHYHDDTASLHL